MKNYTTIINRVLTDWLKEKGWDIIEAGACRADCMDGRRVYGADWIVFGEHEVSVSFTQSELDNNTLQATIEREGVCALNCLSNYIRAKLEKEVME